MKRRGSAETPAAMRARRTQHEEYLAAGWVMVMGPRNMKRRMVRTGRAIAND